MNIAHIETNSFIYGPGCRFVIWVQGCSLHCKGCWNKDMWAFGKATEYSLDEIMSLIKSHLSQIEGVTILGGEPFDQYSELLQLSKQIKYLNLTLMIFTGYEDEELFNGLYYDIFDLADILITGRYVEELRNIDQQWIGSTNQKIHFLTNKYDASIIENGNYLEISIDEFGKETILGFPEKEVIKEISSYISLS